MYLTYNSLAKVLLVWRVRMNFISNKSLNSGTFSCFKRFLMPYTCRTRDMKRKFPSWNPVQENWLSHMTCLLPPLQFTRKNWISTSASIDAQLSYWFGTTLFYVNLPRLRMVLLRMEDVSLGPEPCTLLFLNLLRDEPVRGLNSLNLGSAARKFRCIQWQH